MATKQAGALPRFISIGQTPTHAGGNVDDLIHAQNVQGQAAVASSSFVDRFINGAIDIALGAGNALLIPEANAAVPVERTAPQDELEGQFPVTVAGISTSTLMIGAGVLLAVFAFIALSKK